MRKGSAEPVIRRNLTFPKSFIKRLDALKAKRGGQSDSEILRQGIRLLDACSDPDAKLIICGKDGKKKRIIIV